KSPDFTKQKEKLGALLTLGEQQRFASVEDVQKLEAALSIGKSFPFQEIGFNPSNGGRAAAEALISPTGRKDLTKEILKTLQSMVKQYKETTNPSSGSNPQELLDRDKSNIRKATEIAMGKAMTFEELLEQFG
ncbi:MAG: hypothetical protein LBN94_00645, partial [Puniceicoccales bacterium]|nr:hypothetical protein [Puniceicoccales bacterium]